MRSIVRAAAFFVLVLLFTEVSASQNYFLAYEPFAYPDGPLHQAAAGTGWANGWLVQNGSTTVPGYAVTAASPLDAAGVVRVGSRAGGGSGYLSAGRALDVSTTGPFASLLSGGLIGKSGEVLYAGFLLRKDSEENNDLYIAFHSATPAWWIQSSSLAAGHFSDAPAQNGARCWGLRIGGSYYTSQIPVVTGQAVFLVVRLELGPAGSASLYVNPSADAPLPAEAAVTAPGSVSFHSIGYYGGTSSGQSSVDEIRFATTYTAVAKGSAPPPIAPTGLTATPGNAQVSLSWNAVSDATKYEVWQTSPSPAQMVASSTSTQANITGLLNRTIYRYHVVAWNVSGAGSPSSTVAVAPRGAPPAANARLGTNLTQVSDWMRAWPFVDAFKSARTWISQKQGLPWGQGGTLATNAEGWVTSLQPGQYAETILMDNALEDATATYPTGDYTLLYDGEGTVVFNHQSAAIVSQTPGRMVVNVPSGSNGVYLAITQVNPANPIRNIRFIMPGFESTYQTQPFHPDFLARLQPFKTLRFMEWLLVNGSAMQNWNQRALPSDYTYTWRGVPVEVAVQLANTLQATPWLNIPHMATDDYIRQYATLVRQRLSPSLKVYLEYSNETWNSTFSQTQYVRSQGVALGLSQDSFLAGGYYTALRSTQAFAIWEQVFGGRTQLVRVIASQSANSYLSDQMLGYQNAFTSTDVLAIAPYFSCSDKPTGWGFLGEPATADQVALMTADQVLDIELSHIRNCSLREMQASIAVGAKYGISTVAYEGGQHLVGINGAENHAGLTTVFKAVNRHSRMKLLYDEYLQNWKNSGGDLFVNYSDFSAFTKHGNWGALESLAQDPATAPKYQSLKAFSLANP